RCELDARRNRECLEEGTAVAARPEPGLAKATRDEVGGAICARGARLTAVHVIGGERTHLIEEPGRRRKREAVGARAGDDEREHEGDAGDTTMHAIDCNARGLAAA